MRKQRKSFALIGACVVLLTTAQVGLASPGNGANCASCHSTIRGSVTITGNDTTANPAESCSGTDRGTIPVFRVEAGSSKTLTATLSGVSGATGVIKGFNGTGLETCGTLSYTGGSGWTARSGYSTRSVTTSLSFTINVGANTPADYYNLTFAAAGSSGGRYATPDAHFYLQVVEAAPVDPTIALDKTSLTPTTVQGSNPSNDTFTVDNTVAGSTLNYGITDDASWLTVSPASGSTTGEADTITVQYNTASLAEGTYEATISVADANATNSPQAITVTLTVTAAPVVAPAIALNKTSLTATAVQGSNPSNDTFTVDNTVAGSTLSYEITDDADWLAVSPASGSTTGEADTITVQYNTASLAEGTYEATITVADANATNSPQTIAVTLTVTGVPVEAPTIALNRTTLAASATEGTAPADATFTVGNSGTGTLNYEISADATWLTVSPASGSTTGPADTITVQYDTASMVAGSYPATITVSDAGATNDPQTISVTLTIRPAGGSDQPVITLSTTELTPSAERGRNAPSDTFTVQNTGGGRLSYRISDNVRWLIVTPRRGTSTGETDRITVRYWTRFLRPGTYVGTITVSDSRREAAPEVITVSLTIGSPDEGDGDDDDGDEDNERDD